MGGLQRQQAAEPHPGSSEPEPAAHRRAGLRGLATTGCGARGPRRRHLAEAEPLHKFWASKGPTPPQGIPCKNRMPKRRWAGTQRASTPSLRRNELHKRKARPTRRQWQGGASCCCPRAAVSGADCAAPLHAPCLEELPLRCVHLTIHSPMLFADWGNGCFVWRKGERGLRHHARKQMHRMYDAPPRLSLCMPPLPELVRYSRDIGKKTAAWMWQQSCYTAGEAAPSPDYACSCCHTPTPSAAHHGSTQIARAAGTEPTVLPASVQMLSSSVGGGHRMKAHARKTNGESTSADEPSTASCRDLGAHEVETFPPQPRQDIARERTRSPASCGELS